MDINPVTKERDGIAQSQSEKDTMEQPKVMNIEVVMNMFQELKLQLKGTKSKAESVEETSNEVRQEQATLSRKSPRNGK